MNDDGGRISTDPDYRPDFYDRYLNDETGGSILVCRICGQNIDNIPRDWLDARIADVIPCPGCHLGSRIPTVEEEKPVVHTVPERMVGG